MTLALLRLALTMMLSLSSSSLYANTNCTFVPETYSASLSKHNKIPTHISRTQFSDSTHSFLERLSRMKKSTYKRSQRRALKSCPGSVAKANKIFQKLLAQIEQFNSGDIHLELVVLCSKKAMPPIARLVGGKYIVMPQSLFHTEIPEAQIAAVIAHELAHFSLFHFGRLREKISSSKIKISQKEINQLKLAHEDEADQLALELMYLAGYQPSFAIKHLEAVHNIKQKKSPSRTPSSKHPTHKKFSERVSFLNQKIQHCYKI